MPKGLYWKCTRSNPSKTAQAVEQTVVDLHRTLVQSGKGGRAASVRQALKQQGTEPVPSLRTIYRILQRRGRPPRPEGRGFHAPGWLRCGPAGATSFPPRPEGRGFSEDLDEKG